VNQGRFGVLDGRLAEVPAIDTLRKSCQMET